ncbi:MAG: efflux RND transporter periplasmic adaptor subunit [Gemmatimonadota bacterium]|nr:efflux RND transporter periplasmic adaptor subunit [Gemmatimonadota bacterium]MDH5805808.1 efflux RND transporter periplasmic adaptor subunit [Gemmatimonadota bacterium]
MASRRKKILIIAPVVVGAVGLIASQLGGGPKATSVRADTVGVRSLVSSVTASGRIEPKRSVDIASDITGRIIDLAVEEGDFVQSGQLLLRIDPTQYEAAVQRADAMLSSARASALQAAANRNQAERALDRLTQLRETDQNMVSDEQLETAQTNFEVSSAVAQSQTHQVAQATASLREAQEQLSKTIIRAPMDGKITRLAVEEGEVALASTFSRETGLLMTVSDLSIIQVNVRVDETDVVTLAVGDSTEITIDAFPDTAFAGRVTRIGQSATQMAAATGNQERAVDYDVEITLENPPVDIRPDLSATAKIITDTRIDALSIPIIALTIREHKPISTETNPQDTTEVETEGVFLIRDGVALFQPVRVGITGEEHFEVLTGLEPGDSIVAGPYQTIRDLSDSSSVTPLTQLGDNSNGE